MRLGSRQRPFGIVRIEKDERRTSAGQVFFLVEESGSRIGPEAAGGATLSAGFIPALGAGELA